MAEDSSCVSNKGTLSPLTVFGRQVSGKVKSIEEPIKKDDEFRCNAKDTNGNPWSFTMTIYGARDSNGRKKDLEKEEIVIGDSVFGDIK